MIVAGDSGGGVQVFDVSSRAILKTWKEHRQPVWVSKFNPVESTQLLSASDDRTVRLWDLAAQDSVLTMSGHVDYVRSAAFMTGQASGLILSGSYDQTVRLWDPRAGGDKSIMNFKCASPVEAVLSMPSGTTVLAAADNRLAVLDIIAGKVLRVVQNHQKTITALSLASKDTRVVSGGLDGHVKVYETTGWNVVYGTKYPSPILSLCVVRSGSTREDRHLAVGMQSGNLSIRTRLSGVAKVRERERAQEMTALLSGRIAEHDKKQSTKKRKQDLTTSGHQKRLRGTTHTSQTADSTFNTNTSSQSSKRPPKLSPWQTHLHTSNYPLVLDAALLLPDPQVTATTLQTLRHRSALRAALSFRDESTLMPVLKWVLRYIIDPRYVALCVEVSVLVLELYSDVFVMGVGNSRSGGSNGNNGGVMVGDLVTRLYAVVCRQVGRAERAVEAGGMLALVTA